MLYVLPDTNVLLHGRPVHTLPWEALSQDEIVIGIAGPLIRELDRHKNKPGSLGRRARDLSTLVRDVMKLPNRERLIKDAAPRVRLKVLPALRSKEALHPSLDLENEDHALINIGLELVRQEEEALLLTDDTFAALVADEVGLPYQMLPPDWRRADEPDEIELKARRAIAEAERLRRQEPDIDLRFTDVGGNALDRLQAVVQLYRPLSEDEVAGLMESVHVLCPMAEDFGPSEAKQRVPKTASFPGGIQLSSEIAAMLGEQFVPATEEEISEYKVKHEKWIANVEQRLRSLHSSANSRAPWPEVILSAANNGTRPAEGLLLEIEASGGLQFWRIRERDVDGDEHTDEPSPLTLPGPPTPPSGQWVPRHLATMKGLLRGLQPFGIARPGSFPDHLIRPFVPPTRKADAFYWRAHPIGEASRWSATCEMWRHQGKPEAFLLPLRGNFENGIVRGAISVSAHAKNLSGPARATLPVELRLDEGDTAQLAHNLVEGLIVGR